MENRIKELKSQRDQITEAYHGIQKRLDQICKSDFFNSHSIEECWPVVDNLINQARQARTQLAALDLEIEFNEFELKQS